MSLKVAYRAGLEKHVPESTPWSQLGAASASFADSTASARKRAAILPKRELFWDCNSQLATAPNPIRTACNLNKQRVTVARFGPTFYEFLRAREISAAARDLKT